MATGTVSQQPIHMNPVSQKDFEKNLGTRPNAASQIRELTGRGWKVSYYTVHPKAFASLMAILNLKTENGSLVIFDDGTEQITCLCTDQN